MRKIILASIAIFLGAKYGYGYLMSEKFQAYGDRTKAPWTCHVNGAIGEFEILLSNYSEALEVFQRTIARCPDTPMAESAAFKTARCLDDLGRMNEALWAYVAYAEKYPGTERSRIALRAAQIIRASR